MRTGLSEVRATPQAVVPILPKPRIQQGLSKLDEAESDSGEVQEHPT